MNSVFSIANHAVNKVYVIKESQYKRSKFLRKHVKNNMRNPQEPVFFRTKGEVLHAIDILNVSMCLCGRWDDAVEFDSFGDIVPSEDMKYYMNEPVDFQYCDIDEVYETDIEAYTKIVKNTRL